MSRRPRPPTLALAGCHAGVLLGTLWLAATLGLGPAGALSVAAVGAAPLLAAVPGLRADARYTQQWLTIALVFYVGLGLAETIAAQGSSTAAAVLLFAASAELLLLLRRLRNRGPASRGSTES